jgi:protein-S-isoprenylcysteine O-methyltransferase Ste14
MRNPIRLKNIRARFIPFYLAGGALLWFVRPEPAAYAAGLVAVVAGAGLRSWGAGHLVKTEQLTVTGPYARVRHPLYVGTLLVAAGFALMVGSWISVAALLLFISWFFGSYFPRKEAVEADRLAARYGAPFAEYRAAVPALIPRLHAWTPAAGAAALEDGSGTARWRLDRYSENNELGTLLGLVVCLVAFGVRAWVEI